MRRYMHEENKEPLSSSAASESRLVAVVRDPDANREDKLIGVEYLSPSIVAMRMCRRCRRR